MVQYFQTMLLLVAVTTGVSCQYFDFFSALQPLIYSTTRPQYIEYTTKKQKTHNTNRGQSRTESEKHKGNNRETIYNPLAELLYEQTSKRATTRNTNRNPIDVIIYEETTKRTQNANRNPIVYDRTTKRATTNHSSRRNVSQSNERGTSHRNNTNTNINFNQDITSTKETSKMRQNQPNRNDRITYPDGKLNTVYNYETTKSYTTKSPFIFEDARPSNHYVTQNPLYKPGVKPAVTHGTPITNKPVTHRPYTKPDDDISITPELIFGPNEDYMSTADKKRYIELAERMCDKYKALNIKQIEAIPLLPSPNSVKVNVSSCAPTTIPLVVGGKVVTIQEFPHMALLGWKKAQGSGYFWKCGGSLINNQFILTAGHCAYQDRDNSVIQGPPRVVMLGSSYLNDPNAKYVKVAAVYRHPKYKQPKSYYDVAVVKMATPVTFSDSIKPACLGVPPGVGEPIIATGWGRTEFGGTQSNELRSVSIPVWDIGECYDVLGTSRKIPDGPSSESQICAGEKQGGKDTCQGDSGGPAQVQDGCIWRVTAVTSLGRSCGAPQTPAIYAIVPRAFVAAIAFDGTENRQKDRNTNTQINSNNNQRNNENNDYNNNDRSTRSSVTYNNNDRSSQSSVNYNKNDRSSQSSVNYNNNDRSSQSNVNYNKNDRKSQSGVNYNNNDRDSQSSINYYNNDRGSQSNVNYYNNDRRSQSGLNSNNYDRPSQSSVNYNNNDRRSQSGLNSNNNDRSSQSSVNYNNNESGSTNNQYNRSPNNQRNYETSSIYNNRNQRNNNNDYTTQRNYNVQENYDYNLPRSNNYGAQNDQYYNGDSRSWWT